MAAQLQWPVVKTVIRKSKKLMDFDYRKRVFKLQAQ
jgi:hypothetical protein